MTRVLLTLAALLTAALLTATPASAQGCAAPPGTAAVDQYCENAPSASGNTGGGSGGGGSASKPSRATARAIARSGAGGEELNRYLGAKEVAATRGGGDRSSKRSTRSPSSSKQQEQQPAAKRPQQPSTNALGAVQSSVGSGSTIGDLFIWALIAIALLIAGTAWIRHRKRATS